MYRRMKFRLEFSDLVVNGIHYDSVSIGWEECCTEDEVFAVNLWWINECRRFTTTMTGLTSYSDVTLDSEILGETLTK